MILYLSSHNKKRCLLLSLPSLLMFICLVLAVQTVSAAAKDAQGPVATTAKETKLYTKFSLYYEDLCHRTTNYRKGVLVPVNTEVTFVKGGKKSIIVSLGGSQNLRIENVQEYSGEDIDGIFNRTFSTEKVDLGRFTEAEVKLIKAGEVKPGMTKAAVLVALGYPPKHKTPTLVSDEWRYWRNRFNTFLLSFEEDKLTNIKQ